MAQNFVMLILFFGLCPPKKTEYVCQLIAALSDVQMMMMIQRRRLKVIFCLCVEGDYVEIKC